MPLTVTARPAVGETAMPATLSEQIGRLRWPARPLLNHLFDLHRGIGPTPSVDAIGSTNARRPEYARYGRQTTGAFRRNVRLLKIRSFGSMA